MSLKTPKTILPSVVMAMLVSACTSLGPAVVDSAQPTELNTNAALAAKAEVDVNDGASEDAIDNAVASVSKQTASAAAEAAGDEISHATTEGLPLEINAEVEKWIEYFTVKDRDRMQRFLERGARYQTMISAVLKEQSIPTEIFYQAMIESGFSTHASSSANAVGIWQFMKATGKRYGLRVDAYADERRDPMRATIAASLYMKDLYNVFQSWYLAMAAYNSGEGRILGAIMRSKTRDFWEMVKLRALPSETMAYIPKFLAATIIGHDPRKYGFDDLRPEMMPTLVAVNVPSPVRLADIAQVSGVPLASLKEYNPHLLRGVTPPGVSSYRIWVPKDQAEDAAGWSVKLTASRIKGLKQVTSVNSNAQPKTHRVVRGDSLQRIAGMYGLTVAQLKHLNKLKSSRLVPGQRLTLWTAVPQTFSYKRYRVQRGDNLDVIARRFGVSITDLKKINSLRRSTIYVGQVLKVGAKKG